MRVNLGSIEVDEEWRRALACYHDRHGELASRDDVRNHALTAGESMDADIVVEYADCDICHPESGK